MVKNKSLDPREKKLIIFLNKILVIRSYCMYEFKKNVLPIIWLLFPYSVLNLWQTVLFEENFVYRRCKKSLSLSTILSPKTLKFAFPFNCHWQFSEIQSSLFPPWNAIKTSWLFFLPQTSSHSNPSSVLIHSC